MTNLWRKVTAMTLAFMLVFVSVFSGGTAFVYAGGIEDSDGYFDSGKKIVDAEYNVDFQRMEGLYPATFKYFMANELILNVYF